MTKLEKILTTFIVGCGASILIWIIATVIAMG
jgi:hypothetical protein